MKTCEYCNKEHDGKFATGRFCNRKCSNGFSTKNKRQDINKKVSEKLKGKKSNGWKYVSVESKRIGGINSCKKRKERISNLSFELTSQAERKRRVLKQQDNKCNICRMKEWIMSPLLLQLHHKDGNKYNNKRINLEYLCPNCHSITENYGFKNKKHSNKSKKIIKEKAIFRNKNTYFH